MYINHIALAVLIVLIFYV